MIHSSTNPHTTQQRHFPTFLALESGPHPSSIYRPSWRARSSRKRVCGRWKCIEAAGEELQSATMCRGEKLSQYFCFLFGCVFTKEDTGHARSNAQVPGEAQDSRSPFEFFEDVELNSTLKLCQIHCKRQLNDFADRASVMQMCLDGEHVMWAKLTEKPYSVFNKHD